MIDAWDVRRIAHFVVDHELVFTALAVPPLLFPGRWSPVGLALIALTWVCRWLVHGRPSARTAMDVPIILLLFMTVVSLVPSVARELSLNRLCIYVLGVSLFYGMVNGLHTERHIHYMGIVLVLLGLVVAVVGLLGTDWEIGMLIEMPAIYGRLPGPIIRGLPGSGVIERYDLVNPRVVAGALAMLLPVPIAYLVLGEGWKLRSMSGLVAVVMSGVLLLTQSPQGLLGVGVAIVLVAVWFSRWTLLGVPLALGGLVLASRQPTLTQTFSSWLGPEGIETLEFGLQSRIVNHLRGVGMIRDMPYTGIGLNTFPVVDGLYSFGRSHADHAHNLLIQTGADLGVPGAVALLALLAGFAYTAFRVLRSRPDGNLRALLVGICGALAAWLAYGMLDSITLGHKPAAALWVMLGLTVSMRIQLESPTVQAVPFPKRFGRHWWLAVVLPVVLLAAVAVVSYRRLAGAFYLNLGVLEAHRALATADSRTIADRHLRLAEAHMSRALAWDPDRYRTRRLLEWVTEGDPWSTRWPRDTVSVRTHRHEVDADRPTAPLLALRLGEEW